MTTLKLLYEQATKYNKRKSYKLITVLGNNQNNATAKSDIKHICETVNIDVEYYVD